jgi:hypothetical protein
MATEKSSFSVGSGSASGQQSMDSFPPSLGLLPYEHYPELEVH